MGAVERHHALDDDRFEVRGNLGSGGMGVVYRALDRRLGRDVAMKALRHASGRDLYRFKREFRSLADIVHPNLVALHELHTTGDEWFFTMELVDGCSFIDWVRPSLPRAAPPAADASSDDTLPSVVRTSRTRQEIAVARVDHARLRAVLPQLADGVMALHVSGKLHRDLKPSNVLVDHAGRLVLLDFGLVSELDDGSGETDRTHERAAVGTPAYMSPEQAADQPLTEASDWYSVGVMLYEALTGRRPFEGTAEEVMRRKQSETPPSPRALGADAPDELDRLCMQLLRKIPKDRPDGRAVLAALGGAVSSHTLDLSRATHGQAFVGRAQELGELRRAFNEARRRTVAMFLVGASGMGKTQLVRRFLDDVGEKALVLEGRCYERESVPFKMLDTVVDALATGLMRMPASRLDLVIPRDVAALGRLFPVLRRVPALADRAVGQGVPPDPQELRRRGFGALRFLLGRLAAQAPLVVCIDDLQWGDTDSAVFLADLIHHPEPMPLLLVLVHRPEDDAGVVAQLRQGPAVGRDVADLRSIEVGPLTPSEALELVAKLGGDAASASPALRDAGGHPLYLAELAREAVPGAAPPTLDALLAARIGALVPSAAALLRVVAAAGRPLRLDDAVRAAGEINGWELGRLRADRLVRVRRLGEDAAASLEPYHDRVRAAALSSMSAAEVKTTHRALAETIERRGPSPRDLDGLFDHWERAGDRARAATYASLAAETAEELLAFHRAAELYEFAIEHGPKSEDERRRLERRRADALVNAGQLEEAALAYQAAAEGADERERLELDRLQLEQILRRGRLAEGMARSKDVLDRIGYVLPLSHATAVRSIAWERFKMKLRGGRYHERAEADIPADDLQAVDILQSVSSGLSFVDPMIGRAAQMHLIRRSLALGEPRRVCRALCLEIGYLGIAGAKGRRRVEDTAQRARELAARMDDPYLRGLADACTGLGGFLTGQWKTAREFLDKGLKMLRDHATQGRWETDICELFLTATMFYAGDTKELGRLVPLLLREAVERGDVYAQHGLRGWRSNIAWLVLGQPGDARAHVLAVASERAPQDEFNLHHYYETLAHGQIDLYLGDGESVRARVAGLRKPLARALLTRIQTVRIETEFLAARASLMAALGRGDLGKAQAELSESRTAAKRLEQEGAPWATALARLCRGMIAAAVGDADAASSALAQAERELGACGLRLVEHVARLRRGEVEGGPGGGARAQAALDWMRENGVADPASMAQMLAPART